MADNANLFKIQKLDNENYDTWSFIVQTLLEKEKLVDALSEEFIEVLPPESSAQQAMAFDTRRSAWKEKQDKIKQIIILTCQPSQLIHIKRAKTGSEAWKILRELHVVPTLAGKIQLMMELFKTEIEANGDMRAHLDKLMRLMDKLHEMEAPLPPEYAVGIIMSSVRDHYSAVVTAMEAWPEDRMTPRSVKAKLLEEYEKRRNDRVRIKSQIQAMKSNILEEKKAALAAKESDEWNEMMAEQEHGLKNSTGSDNEVARYSQAGAGRYGANSGNGNSTFRREAGRNGAGSSGSTNIRRTAGNNAQSGRMEAGRGQRDVFLCHSCWKPGHFRAQCPFEKEKMLLKNQANKHVADDGWYLRVLLHDNISGNNWVVDSGATAHMCKDKKMFESIDETRQGKVFLGDGRSVKSGGKGKVKLTLHSDSGKSVVTINDVLHVPQLSENLISVRKLAEKGHIVEFSEDKCYLKGEKRREIAKIEGGLYRLHVNDEECCTAELEDKERCIHEWHVRLAHRNLECIKKLASQGLKIKNCDHNDTCEECLKGKMSRRPFPKTATPTENVMDVVVSDVCGFMQTESLGKRKYFVTFIDLYSRFCDVYFIKEKSEVPDVTIEYITKMENQLGKLPKVFRSDRGTEYLNAKLQNFFKIKGIVPQCTVGYAPEQNGVAERKNRTLVEAARSMIAEAGFPKRFWAEAINTANHVINRIAVGKKGTMKSPYEKIFGKKPNLMKLQPFGAPVYVMIPDEKRRKLDNKAKKMRFVGYDSMAKGYRLADENNKIIISREVKFIGDGETFSSKKGNGRENNKQTKVKTPEILSTEKETTETHPEYFKYDPFGNPVFNQLPDPEPSVEIEEEEFHDAESEQEENRSGTDNEEEIVLRRSARTTKGQAPDRLTYKAAEENRNSEPKSFKEAMSSKNADNWMQAIKEELNAISDNETWEIADLPLGRRSVGSKWVFKEKKDSNGKTIRFKARLVAQGFSQKYGVDYDEVFAPVARQTTFRLLLSIAGTRKYHVRHYDIKSAFLNGKLEEEIFMKQPPGFQTGSKVFRLKKSLYGLKQSARVWNQTLHDALVKQGFKQNIIDNCLYSWKSESSVCHILIHVDDLLVTGNDVNTTKRLMESIGRSFEMTNLGGATHYLGIDIEQDRDGRFVISQPGYIDSIVTEAGLTEGKTSKFPLDTGYAKQLGTPLKSNNEYRKLIGMLLYLTTNTRPDIAASVSILSRKVEHPRDNDMVEVKRVIRYLKGTRNLKLLLNEIGETNELIVYSDANWAEDTDDRKSNTGYFVALNGGTISWCCRKQDLVAMSSAESEYIALAETCKEVLWLQEIMKGLDIDVGKTTTILTDSQSCIALLKNQKFSHKTKHFDTRYHFIRDHVMKGSIELRYVPTDENTADLMTKPLGGTKTEYFRGKAGLIEVDIKSSTSRRSVEHSKCSNNEVTLLSLVPNNI